MQRKSLGIVWVSVIAFGSLATVGCGPKCAKVITAKAPEDLSYEDGLRINKLVKRRAAAMKEAEGGNMYTLEAAKATVTACEFAIHMMVRTRTLMEEGSPLYEQNLSEINDTRCFLEDVVDSKGRIIGKGKDAFLSSGDIKEIRKRYEKFASLFGKEGKLSERAVNVIYNEGVTVKKPGGEAPAGEGAAAEEGGEGETDGAAAAEEGEGATGEDDVFGDDGAAGEGSEDEGSGGMDSF